MKSCDFLFFSFSWIGPWDVYHDNRLACKSQSWNVVLRVFVILSWILTPRNVVALKHFVSARLSDVTQTLIKTKCYSFRVRDTMWRL